MIVPKHWKFPQVFVTPPPGCPSALYWRPIDRAERSNRAAKPAASSTPSTTPKFTPESGSIVPPADGFGVGTTVGPGSVGLLRGVATGVADGDAAALGFAVGVVVGVAVVLGVDVTVGVGEGTSGLGGTHAGSMVKRTDLCSTKPSRCVTLQYIAYFPGASSGIPLK